MGVTTSPAESQLLALVARYPGLSIVPGNGDQLRARGWLDFRAAYNNVSIEDSYQVQINVPRDFPRTIPTVTEISGRIPQSFHTHPDKTLCLGSPTRLRLCLRRDPTLTGFVENCLVPYLYGFSFRQRNSYMPFGELAHGTRGLLQDLAELFQASNGFEAFQLARLASLNKTLANKQSCPCGSRRSLADCHGSVVDTMREALGKEWFAEVCVNVWVAAEIESSLGAEWQSATKPSDWDWRALLPRAGRVAGFGKKLQPTWR